MKSSVASVFCVLFAAGVGAGCAARQAAPAASPAGLETPSTPLIGEHGETLDARALVGGAPYTVLVFFSPDCHCLSVHEPRLFALAAANKKRGVAFYMVDSEAAGTSAGDAYQAASRRYPFPILGDRGAKLADALGAKYATYSVVVDASGRVRYRGGIDSDKTHLRDDAAMYLKDALDDLASGREPRVAEGKALGCALQKW